MVPVIGCFQSRSLGIEKGLLGDTIVVNRNPVNYPGGIYPRVRAFDLLEVTDVTIIGVVLEGFESCQFWFYSVERCN